MRRNSRPGNTVVAYCHSGIRAAHAWFVARYLGHDAKVYDGSVVDWSRHAEATLKAEK